MNKKSKYRVPTSWWFTVQIEGRRYLRYMPIATGNIEWTDAAALSCKANWFFNHWPGSIYTLSPGGYKMSDLLLAFCLSSSLSTFSGCVLSFPLLGFVFLFFSFFMKEIHRSNKECIWLLVFSNGLYYWENTGFLMDFLLFLWKKTRITETRR